MCLSLSDSNDFWLVTGKICDLTNLVEIPVLIRLPQCTHLHLGRRFFPHPTCTLPTAWNALPWCVWPGLHEYQSCTHTQSRCTCIASSLADALYEHVYWDHLWWRTASHSRDNWTMISSLGVLESGAAWDRTKSETLCHSPPQDRRTRCGISDSAGGFWALCRPQSHSPRGHIEICPSGGCH